VSEGHFPLRQGVGKQEIKSLSLLNCQSDFLTGAVVLHPLHIIRLFTQYWRIDYAGIEQYSAFSEDGRTLLNAKLQREHTAFAHIWDANLRAQGFLEAFVRQQKGNT